MKSAALTLGYPQLPQETQTFPERQAHNFFPQVFCFSLLHGSFSSVIRDELIVTESPQRADNTKKILSCFSGNVCKKAVCPSRRFEGICCQRLRKGVTNPLD